MVSDIGVPSSCVAGPRVAADLLLPLSGFAVVGDYEDATIKTAQATAYEQMLKWIRDH